MANPRPHILRSAPIEHSRTFYQFDFIDREGIEAPSTGQNKDNIYQCKKHSSPGTVFLSHVLSLETGMILMFRLV